MHEPGGHCSELNKPGTERHTLCDSAQMRHLRQIHRIREWNGGFQGLGVGQWEVTRITKEILTKK